MADEPFLAGVDAKEEIEHNARYGYEPNHQCPGHRLGWLTIVHYYMYNGQYDDDVVNDNQDDVQFVHRMGGRLVVSALLGEKRLLETNKLMCLQGEPPLRMLFDIVDALVDNDSITLDITCVAGLEE